VSTACKEAVIEKFAQMTEVHFCEDGEEVHFYRQHVEQVGLSKSLSLPQLLSIGLLQVQMADTDHSIFEGPFIVTKWFAAYLSLHNCLHIQALFFDATTTDSIRRRRGGVDAIGDQVHTVPATRSILSQLLEIDCK